MTRLKRAQVILYLGLAIAGFPIAVPQALAFLYHTTAHGSEFWSERPLDQAQLDVIAVRAARLVGQSPIAKPDERRHVFLTDGGWRWNWLALNNRGTFGLTRPLNEAVIINGGDPATDSVRGGRRTLSGTLAHETCHGVSRRHFGLTVVFKPTWLTEGYCDYVAQESNLSDAEAIELHRIGSTRPALVYYDGRRRVAAILKANGGNVDALFTAN